MAKTLEVGDKAPDFTMPTDGGGSVSLADFKGKTLVLYFYPKDSTPGCTTQAIGFSQAKADFEATGAAILGVSKDSVKRHDNFIAKQELTITLGSDEEGKVVEDYGVWIEKKNYGRVYMGIDRSTFIIDGKGIIREIWHKVRVKEHVAKVLEAVSSL